MSLDTPRIKVPETARAGEVITIKTLLSHRMESGHRKGLDGKLVPRRILVRFTCEFDHLAVFDVELSPAIAANPFFEFHARVPHSGTFRFTWTSDAGEQVSVEQPISVV